MALPSNTGLLGGRPDPMQDLIARLDTLEQRVAKLEGMEANEEENEPGIHSKGGYAEEEE